MQDPNALGVERKRQVTILEGAGEEGIPALGTEEITEMRDGGLVVIATTRLTYCGGCNAALHDAAEIGGVCVVCHRVLCLKSCSTVRCSECAKSVCKTDSVDVGDTVVCRPDFNEQTKVRVLVLALIVLAGIGLLVLLNALLNL